MPVFVFSIFLSAFLLFQVQPVVARYILPWYGGSPAVWTTCMLCFQVGLLAGYAYAHGLATWWRNKPRRQVAIHVALILLSLLLLPITPSESLKPGPDTDPAWGIVKLILLSVGLPFIVISASGPLMQHWFASAFRGPSPYRLYAVSNFGSLLGLISYPFLFEPLFGLRTQTHLWSWTYVAYGIIAALCGWQFLKRFAPDVDNSPAEKSAPPPASSDRVLWATFAALGSVLLLATTNQMCQDVAVVPFLWVLPLSLYLVTFIISFDHARWYHRGVWIPLAIISVAALVYLFNQDFADDEIHVAIQVAIFTSAMFTCCMICHGEMVRIKPAPRYLTSFYLIVALGGALGGLLVSQVAPRILPGYWEFHIVLVAIAALTLYRLWDDIRPGSAGIRARYGIIALGLPTLVALAFFLAKHIVEQVDGAIATSRSFYGVLRVYEEINEYRHWRALFHGRINHGEQYFDSAPGRTQPTAYYIPTSGAALAADSHPKRQANPREPMKIGVVGLGTGNLAYFAEKNDTIRFYEINSEVERLARSHFTFLEECPADLSVIIGDARISMEQELANQNSQNFDLLYLDAFSGDSIPLHLFTREAFSLFLEHLDPEGILVLHITNLHLDLSDPVRTLAGELGLHIAWVEYNPVEDHDYYSSWVLLSRSPASLALVSSKGYATAWERPARPTLWTDDHVNLLEVIIWD